MFTTSPALAGGSWLDPTWERVEAGDTIRLSGDVSTGQLGWVDGGPYYAYLSGADYGLATGPLTAADGAGTPQSFYVGMATPDGVAVEAQRSGGHPAMARVRSAKQALNLLRLTLIGKMP